MTQRQTSRSRVLRRAGVALAAAVAVSTVASTAGAASKPQASKYGGTAKVAIFDTFAGWCFANNNANSSLMAVRTVYETLFEKTIGGDMVGLLAESATPSSDLKTWTIKLRPNVKFHDGTAMDASAVKQNIDFATASAWMTAGGTAAATNTAIQTLATTIYTKLVSPKSVSNPIGGDNGTAILKNLGITDTASSKTVSNIGTVAFHVAIGTFAADGSLDDSLDGTKDKKGGSLKALGLANDGDAATLKAAVGIGTTAAFISNIIKVTAVDTLTLELKLDRAQNDVPGMLYASGRFFIRGPKQFTQGKDTCSTGRPIGTGPFKTADNYTLVSTDTLSVVKNPDYWRTNPINGDKLPYLDGITFTNVKEGSQRAAAVRKGTYDIGQFSSASEATFIKDLRQRKSVVTEYKSASEYYPSLWLNQGKAGSVFASKNARLAVLHCLDRANYVKVRTKGEATVAKSLVGPKSVMYTTRGFQAFNVAKSKEYVKAWQAEAGNAGKTLEFTFPSDVATASQANAKFFQSQWAKCGIKANIQVEEAAQIIAKTFNSGAASAAEQNAYDAIFILLFEGTDVSFNLPFVLTNAFPANSTNVAAPVLRGLIGSILNLNKYSDTNVDKAFYAGQAASNTSVSKVKYQEGTAIIQTEGYMGSVSHFYYTMFVNKKNGLTNIGKTPILKGKTQRVVTNWGIDWSGVQKIAGQG